jgi:toxin ParE1/3/4
MTAHRFTRSAQEDLIDIWLYTQETWGEAQADVYQDALHLCCERLRDRL